MDSSLGNLVVEVRGLRSRKGRVLAALYDKATGFPLELELAYQRQREVIDDEAFLELVFYDVPVGRYALAVLHDEDDDGKLSTNIFGIPTDGLGVSNFDTNGYQRPGFDAASFDFKGHEMRLTVRMLYMA